MAIPGVTMNRADPRSRNAMSSEDRSPSSARRQITRRNRSPSTCSPVPSLVSRGSAAHPRLLACNRMTRSPAKARETLLSLLTRVNIVPARVIAFGLDWRRSGPQASPDQPRRGACRGSIPSDGELCPQRRHPTADLPGGSGTGLESRRGPALHARSQCPHAEDEGERHRSRRHGGCHAGASAGTGDRPPHPPGGRGGLHPSCRLLGHSVPDGLQSRPASAYSRLPLSRPVRCFRRRSWRRWD